MANSFISVSSFRYGSTLVRVLVTDSRQPPPPDFSLETTFRSKRSKGDHSHDHPCSQYRVCGIGRRHSQNSPSVNLGKEFTTGINPFLRARTTCFAPIWSCLLVNTGSRHWQVAHFNFVYGETILQ